MLKLTKTKTPPSGGVNFSKMPAVYWSNTTKMNYLQRRIIVYSIMYYGNGESCVSDAFYDAISMQLVDLMKTSTKLENESTTYWYAMYDFDGSTGFHLPSRLTKSDSKYLGEIAANVYNHWKKNGGEILV